MYGIQKVEKKKEEEKNLLKNIAYLGCFILLIDQNPLFRDNFVIF